MKYYKLDDMGESWLVDGEAKLGLLIDYKKGKIRVLGPTVIPENIGDIPFEQKDVPFHAKTLLDALAKYLAPFINIQSEIQKHIWNES